jgi:ClpP class serine protease
MRRTSKTIKRLTFSIKSRDSLGLISKKLSNTTSSNTLALFIDIPGGGNFPLTQSEKMANMILNFREKNKDIPVYTFAEEKVIGSQILLHLAGGSAFLDKFSMIGLFDFITKRNSYKKYLDSKNFTVKITTAGEHKIRLNPFEEIKEQDKEWINSLLLKQKELLFDRIYEFRKNKLTIKREEIGDYLNSSFISSEKAVSIGLFDDCHSMETFRAQKFPDEKIENAHISKMEMIKILTNMRGNVVHDLLEPNLNVDLFNAIDKVAENIEAEYIEYISESNLKLI